MRIHSHVIGTRIVLRSRRLQTNFHRSLDCLTFAGLRSLCPGSYSEGCNMVRPPQLPNVGQEANVSLSRNYRFAAPPSGAGLLRALWVVHGSVCDRGVVCVVHP